MRTRYLERVRDAADVASQDPHCPPPPAESPLQGLDDSDSSRSRGAPGPTTGQTPLGFLRTNVSPLEPAPRHAARSAVVAGQGGQHFVDALPIPAILARGCVTDMSATQASRSCPRK